MRRCERAGEGRELVRRIGKGGGVKELVMDLVEVLYRNPLVEPVVARGVVGCDEGWGEPASTAAHFTASCLVTVQVSFLLPTVLYRIVRRVSTVAFQLNCLTHFYNFFLQRSYIKRVIYLVRFDLVSKIHSSVR